MASSILEQYGPDGQEIALARSWWLMWAIRSLAVAACGISLYLTWQTWGGSSIAGCGGETLGADCDRVLSSVWSKWLGLPVGLLATGVYVSILLASFFVPLRRGGSREAGWAEVLFVALVLTAAGAAGWFIYLQWAEVGAYCLYCLTVHGCGVVIAGLTAQHFLGPAAARATGARVPANVYLPAGALAALLVGALIGGQLLFAPETTGVVEVPPPDGEAGEAGAEDALAAGEVENDHFQPPGVAPVNESTTEEIERNDAEDREASEPLKSTEGSPKIERTTLKLPGPPDEIPEIPLLPPKRSGDFSAETPNSEHDASAPRVNTPPEKPPHRRRKVVLLKGHLKFDLYQVPHLGSPEAPHVMAELIDYTCPHCRHLAPRIEAARVKYGEKLVICVLPTPLDPACNGFISVTNEKAEQKQACRYAQLALALWQVRPEAFEEYHHWLMEGPEPPAVSVAARRAIALAGGYDALYPAIHSSEVTKQIRTNVALFGLNSKQLPGLIFSKVMVRGLPQSDRELYSRIEQFLPEVRE